MDFDCPQGEVILVDEADELIFNDPARFLDGIQQRHCICLTATPDNQKKGGVEREVLKAMGFSSFNGQPDVSVVSDLASVSATSINTTVSETVVVPTTTNTVTTVSDFKMNETRAYGACSE